MTSLHPDPRSFERRRWLIAVFDTEARARRAAEDAQRHGTLSRSIRIGSSLDALGAIGPEAQAETHADAHARHRFRSLASSWLRRGSARERPRQVAATVGTILALPDTEPARRSLLRSGPERIDVFGAGGHLISTLLTNDRER
jgi:hypothetical protein